MKLDSWGRSETTPEQIKTLEDLGIPLQIESQMPDTLVCSSKKSCEGINNFLNSEDLNYPTAKICLEVLLVNHRENYLKQLSQFFYEVNEKIIDKGDSILYYESHNKLTRVHIMVLESMGYKIKYDESDMLRKGFVYEIEVNIT